MLTRRAFRELSNVAETQPQASVKKPVEAKTQSETKKSNKKSIEVQSSREKKQDQNAPTIENIDAYYKGSLIFLSDYAPDVFHYLMTIEARTSIKPWPSRSLVTPNMRCRVIDWIASVVNLRHLLQESFQMTVALFDRYLEARNRAVDKASLQLVALCCLSLAVKYEEIKDLQVCDLLGLSRNKNTRQEFVQMEMSILKTVEFSLGRPLPITFLRRFNMVAKADRVQHAYGKFLLDLCMLEANLCHVPPSLLAATTTFIALCIVKNNVSHELWPPTFVHYTTFEFDRLKPLVSTMATVLKNRGGEFTAVRRKYSKSEQFSVSETIQRHEGTLSLMTNLK